MMVVYDDIFTKNITDAIVNSGINIEKNVDDRCDSIYFLTIKPHEIIINRTIKY